MSLKGFEFQARKRLFVFSFPGRGSQGILAACLCVLFLTSCVLTNGQETAPAQGQAPAAGPALTVEEQGFPTDVAVLPTPIPLTEPAPGGEGTMVAPELSITAGSGPLPGETQPGPEEQNESVLATDAATEEPIAPAPVAFPDPGGYAWRPVVGGLNSPVGLSNANDGSNRLFVIEQAGLVRIIKDGQLLPQPFLDIVSTVGSSGNEQGLLGLAFHPWYSSNGFFYVNYTDRDGKTQIARFTVSSDDQDRADPESQVILLSQEQPYANHNGGMMAFGPEGYLYIGLGDGGSAGDPQGNAQNLNSLLGKILRIDVDTGKPYGIPAGNPFSGGGGRPEVWAYGLRNPWRFSFDRSTGDLYIADVGQNQWEEINFLRAGSAGKLNFGWDYFEASYPYDGTPPVGEVFLQPVAEYRHDQGCSVTGGYVYRGSSLPDWQGIYLFGDFCTGDVWGSFRTPAGSWQTQILFRNVGRITSFGEDESGEIYLVDRGGVVFRLER